MVHLHKYQGSDMGVVCIVAAGVAWILVFEPQWITNHWTHWLFGDWIDDDDDHRRSAGGGSDA